MTPSKFELNQGQRRALDNVLYKDFRFNLLYGGSRSGKTLLDCRTIIQRALVAPGSRHLMVRQEGTSAKRALVKGTIPEVVAKCFDGLVMEWKEQYGYYILPGGSEVWVGGLNDDKALEKILGNEYATIFLNEASEIKYSAFTLLRSRLAQVVKNLEGEDLKQKMLVDLNPTTRMHWTYRLWVDGVDPDTEAPVDVSNYGHEVVNPYDNLPNLSADYIADLEALPDRARRRFLEGKYIEDVENALWSRSMLKRVANVPDMARIVVAIDPAVSSEPGSDETGIVCCGIDGSGLGYVLADDSGKYKPEEWARKAVALYDYFDADRVVGEINQGGDMVESVIRAVRNDVPYTGVRATRGKYTRAEPVAALYERNKVFHTEEFGDLEDQMCSFTTDFDRRAQGWSPDRVDALVWAFTDLFPQMTRRKRSNTGPILRPIGTMA